MFCRPAYSDVLTFHEIDGGEVGVDDVKLLEQSGAGIAHDYREVMRKLLGLMIPPESTSTSRRLRPIQ